MHTQTGFKMSSDDREMRLIGKVLVPDWPMNLPSFLVNAGLDKVLSFPLSMQTKDSVVIKKDHSLFDKVTLSQSTVSSLRSWTGCSSLASIIDELMFSQRTLGEQASMMSSMTKAMEEFLPIFCE